MKAVEYQGISYSVPYGVLFDYNDGNNCGTRGGFGSPYKEFVGSLWLPHNYVSNCQDGGFFNSLKKCTFPKNTIVEIWADDSKVSGECFNWGPFKLHKCGYSQNNCPKLAICPT